MAKLKIDTDAKLIRMLNTNQMEDDLSNYVVSTYYIFNRPDWDEFARNANSIFNKATYLMRQNLIKHHKYLSYSKLDHIFKQAYKNKENLLYLSVGYVQAAQQSLKLVKQNFKSYKQALKAYKKNPHKFTGRPKLPHCHKPGSRSLFVLTNQSAKVKNGYLIAKKCNVKLKLDPKFTNFKLVRVTFVPITNGFKVLVTFEIAPYRLQKDNGTYIAIDPGVDNAFACVCNKNFKPLLINGKTVKSINHYYNKKKSLLKSKQAKYHQQETIISTKQGPKPVYTQTKRMNRLDYKRNRKLDLFAYKALNCIVDYAINCNAKVVFIGKNKGWKNKVNLNKKNNQNFLGIPHAIIINKLKAKLAYYGIRLITTEESYTSQTSFLDNERPCKANGNLARKKKGIKHYKRRIKRGLFKSNKGILINSDVNGALQIAKKGFAKWQSQAKQNKIYAFPKLSFGDEIQALVLMPQKVNCSIPFK